MTTDEIREHEHEYHREHRGSARSWMMGFVVGGLSGLAASLLWAPQSGRETRELVRYKATQLRQAAEQTAQETMEKVEQLTDEAKDKVGTMRQKGMEYVEEQKTRVGRVANAVTEAAKDTWDEAAAAANQPKPTPMGSTTGSTAGNQPKPTPTPVGTPATGSTPMTSTSTPSTPRPTTPRSGSSTS